MAITLKKIQDQVVVITGASSGIGLVTARMAAQQGARLVLASRNDEALQSLANEITSQGGHAVHVQADVGKEEDLRRVAETAQQRFGGFDTWVNNAGVSIYGRVTEVSINDMQRLFETNFWGVVYGSRIAAEHLRLRGGALINIGSTLSDRTIPLQGIYCASKFAVRSFTDALRMELEEAGAPVSVTLIKPAAIDTPYTEHAKNYLPNEPQNPAPVYPPEAVAEAILHAAQHPVRDLFVGAAGKAFSLFEKYAPRVADKYMEKNLFQQQQTDTPEREHGDHGLYKPGAGLKERGNYAGHVASGSLYTKASMHPVLTGITAVTLGLVIAGILQSQRDEE